MDINTILKLFPSARLEDQSRKRDFLALAVGKKWLNIPLSSISKREESLLKLIVNNIKPKINSTNPWVQYLCNNGSLPNFTGQVRFLFFKVEINYKLISNWKKALENMFNSPILALFQINDKEFCLVEKITKNSYNKQDFLGVLQTIDNDVDSKTKMFIGHSWIRNAHLYIYYEEEFDIFKQENERIISSTFTFSMVALSYLTRNNLKKSKLIAYYHKKISEDQQLESIITTLYKNEGNISLTAKDLYLHRNTLLYHIEKTNKNLNLNLRKTNDLVLAYLATLY